MSYILHIETSTKVCSVSLGKNGKLIASKEEYSEKYILLKTKYKQNPVNQSESSC